MNSDTKNEWVSLNKSERINLLQSRIKEGIEKYPANYSHNEIQEDIVLEYVRRFESQYRQMLPRRRKLFLIPRNETSQSKFISTNIKPTELKFPELYDCIKCAHFIRDYVTYEPLPSRSELPQILVTPTTVLKFQRGDSFDMSTMLVSFLIGCGYDAYCVYGYVHPDVAECRLEKKLCPFPLDLGEEEVSAKDVKKESKYRSKIPDRPELDIGYTFKATNVEVIQEEYRKEQERRKKEVEMLERIRQLEDEISRGELHDSDEEETDDEEEGEDEELTPEEKLWKTQSLHCWVLVIPRKQDLDEPFFIEVSTGERIEVTNKQYFYIEACWNHRNYWVNMQKAPVEEKKKLSRKEKELKRLRDEISSAKETPESKYEYKKVELNYDLENRKHWENMFLTEKGDEDIIPSELDADVLDVPVSYVQNIRILKRDYEARYPNYNRKVRFLDQLQELYSPFRFPNRLVRKITLFDPSNNYESIQAIHEFYQKRKDGMIRTSTNRKDDKITKIEVFFEKREDGLELIVEDREALTTTYTFWAEYSLDGLSKREEIFKDGKMDVKKKVINYYTGRDDRLIYRSIAYDTSKMFKTPGEIQHELSKSGRGMEEDDDDDFNYDDGNERENDEEEDEDLSDEEASFRSKGGDVGIYGTVTLQECYREIKKTEKYSRNLKVEASEDIAKINYFGDRIRVDFHYEEDGLTHLSIEFDLLDQLGKTKVNGAGPYVKMSHKKQELLKLKDNLKQLEKKCDDELKNVTMKIKKLLRLRKRENEKNEIVTSIYDTDWNPKDAEEEEMESDDDDDIEGLLLEKKEEEGLTQEEIKRKELLKRRRRKKKKKKHGRDILSLELGPKEPIRDAQHAQEIYWRILGRIKERILLRAKILDERLKEENELMSKSQAKFQKLQQHQDTPGMDISMSDLRSQEFLKIMEETQFRMSILSDRIKQNQKESIEEYDRVQRRLVTHPKLKKWLVLKNN